MNFTTKVPLAKSDSPIEYKAKILSLGSCFAENMGEQFGYYKFQSTVNPFGIIFNPVSIARLVTRVVAEQVFTEADIFFHNDLWHCYEVHSELSHLDKEVFLQQLNEQRVAMHKALRSASHLIITYGTSWVYRLKDTGAIVANCHKVPQSAFDKHLLTVAEIEAAIQSTITTIQQLNPDVQVIVTLSPVRHIKDGFMENQRSKAHLITAIHQILNPKFAQLEYFPAYEILLDELRDYRFYADDMLHPSAVAIDYIWECFSAHYMSTESLALMQEVAAIQKGLAHRPFNPDTANHQKFLQSLNQKILRLQEQLPHIQF